MTYMVELRYIDGDLAGLMRDMRSWLDRNRIEAEEFYHSSAPPGLAFRIGFRHPDNAAAFADAFGGWVEGAEGIGLCWTHPHSLDEACSRPTPECKRSRPAVG